MKKTGTKKNTVTNDSRNITNRFEQYEKRVPFINILFLIVFGIVSIRTLYLHLIPDQRVSNLILTQYQKKVEIRAKRGFIYDSNNEALAISLSVYSIFAEPRRIKPEERNTLISELNKILGIKKKSLRRKLSTNKGFIWIKRQVSDEIAQKIESLKLPHIHMVKEGKRFYPNGSLAGQILGFTDIDSIGLEGIEVRYDNYLQGEKIHLQINRDAKGRRLLLKESAQSLVNKQGASVTLTINKNIQYITEKALEKQVEATKAASGIAIVMDPFDGRILAMANVPKFDPNIRNKQTLQFKKNRCITDTYEPGSTFKSFIIATALEKNAISLSEKLSCENGLLHIGKRTIRDTHPYDSLTPMEIIRSSSNIGAYKIAKRLGKVEMFRYLKKFGFGTPTGIDFRGESPGILHSPDTWKEIRFSNIAFGQGVSTSSLQLITAYSAIANGGFLVTPYLVDKIVSKNNEILYSHNPPLPKKVISKKTAEHMTRMLEEVVYDKEGTGSRSQITGFRVAGKTGTTEKFDPAIIAYSPNKRIGSFVGFVPSTSPKIVLLVVIDEPTEGLKYGGVVAAPVFAKIGTQILNYLEVMPDSKETESVITEISIGAPIVFQPKNIVKEIKKAKKAKLYTKKKLAPLPLDRPLFSNEGKSIIAKDLSGFTVRKVFREASSYPITIRLIGNGIITRQKPDAGIKMQPGETLTLYCGD